MGNDRMIWKNARFKKMDLASDLINANRTEKGFDISREELQKRVDEYISAGGTVETVSVPWDDDAGDV